MAISRRNFLKYATAALIGGSATTLSTQYLLSTSSRSSATDPTPSNMPVVDDLDARYKPPEYLELMEWLQDVSKPYKGKKLVTAFELEPSPLGLQRMDPDYFKHTGIDVGYELAPYTQNLLNTTLAISTQAPTYDLINVDNSQLARFKDHLIPPQELAERYPEITFPNLDTDDFFDSAWAFSSKYPQDLIFPPYGKHLDGKVFEWPQDMPMMVRFYRKDLYENAGITPGKTWEEYREDLRMFNDSSAGYFGGASMAFSHISIIFEYLNHLHSFGGKIWEIDEDGIRCVISSDEAITALENYVQLKQYSDPVSSSSTWAEVGLMMTVGRVVNAIQFADYASTVNNPIQSKTPGKWGYLKTPEGPEGSFSTFAGAGVGVSRYSRNPEAAWLWLQWATSLGTQKMVIQDPLHHSVPTRMKVYNDPVIQQKIETGNLDYLKVIKDIMAESHVATLISFPAWPQIRLILSRSLSQCWSSTLTPREAIKQIQEEIDKVGPVFKF